MSLRDENKETKAKYYLSNPMGIHRVMSLPYDDSECFYSIYSLLEYCKEHNTWYNGQKVTCIMNNEMGVFRPSYLTHVEIDEAIPHIQKFTIFNGKPLPDFDNNIELKRYGNNTFVQVYYYNPSMFEDDNELIMENDKYHTMYLDNPMKFSILDLIGIFTDNSETVRFHGYVIDLEDNNEKIEFNFSIRRRDLDYNTSHFFNNYLEGKWNDDTLRILPYHMSSVSNGFISDNTTVIHAWDPDKNGGLYSLVCKNPKTDNFILANIIPITDAPINKRYVVSIYVKMSDEYCNALEARL